MKNRIYQLLLLALMTTGVVGSVGAQKLAMEEAYKALEARYEKRVVEDPNLAIDLRTYLATYPY